MATLNISRDNVKGKCDLKCSYNFKYSDSTTTAKNNGEMISLTYDNSSATQVLYNNKKYTVTSIYITSPSIHTFNGSTTDAEICIEHTPLNGGPLFSVGIPIKSSSDATPASSLLTEIISASATSIPTNGNSASLNIAGFSLDKIVPNKPFFSYTSSTDNMQWIVYGIVDAIPLNSSALATLGQIIAPFPLTMSGDALFYNSTGPNSVSIGEGIYIKCNPTGSSEEEVSIDYAKNQTSSGLNDLFSGSLFTLILQSIVLIIIVILFFYLIKFIYGRIRGGATGVLGFGKMPFAKAE
jgi:carbonic anhydrase